MTKVLFSLLIGSFTVGFVCILGRTRILWKQATALSPLPNGMAGGRKLEQAKSELPANLQHKVQMFEAVAVVAWTIGASAILLQHFTK